MRQQDDSGSKCESLFKAADVRTTSWKQNAFHEAGEFGSTCARHSIPLEFTNIFLSGERYQLEIYCAWSCQAFECDFNIDLLRYKYPLAVMDVLVSKYGNTINVPYDIACRLKPALYVCTLPSKKFSYSAQTFA